MNPPPLDRNRLALYLTIIVLAALTVFTGYNLEIGGAGLVISQ